MFAAALALAAAASWGVGDFLGGLKSRSLSPIAVLIAAQPVGLAFVGIFRSFAKPPNDAPFYIQKLVIVEGDGPRGAM